MFHHHVPTLAQKGPTALEKTHFQPAITVSVLSILLDAVVATDASQATVVSLPSCGRERRGVGGVSGGCIL